MQALGSLSAAEQACNDKYVVVFDFAGNDAQTAIDELNALLNDLHSAGLHTEVRAGYDQTLLVFVKAPRELLGNTVYKSRVKDWLYGVTTVRPEGNKDTVVEGAHEAEDLLSLFHLVNWPKDQGGAGITPGAGKWVNVKAIFPLHNHIANQTFLRHVSRRLLLSDEDLDKIRDLLGSKVAFYFAFIQTYLVFLTFPALVGIVAWLWLPRYSLFYAITTSVWCAVFLEYWKTQSVDLALRWGVQGVGQVKLNRPQFRYERIIAVENGHTIYYYPRWKYISRQLLQIPFMVIAAAVLGMILTLVFALEVLISELYFGPFKFYLEYLPTVLLATLIPSMSSSLEGIAEWLTEYENHRTADRHEMASTQKKFAFSVLTNYVPILLIAFIYVPFGEVLVPWLEASLQRLFSHSTLQLRHGPFEADTDKLRNEVIALTVTGQLSSFFEENILPWLKHKAQDWYRNYRRARSNGTMLLAVVSDEPDEAEFLTRVRDQATLDSYNVQDDIAEIVLQFGYLALFAPVWPVLPLGFLVNNWVELRSDFIKICIEHQRPAPVRADGIGPWIISLECLTWAGSICTAATVHLFGSASNLWSLPATVFVSEHVLFALRALVRFFLGQIGSEERRRERRQRFAARSRYLEEIEANKRAGLGLSPAEKERRTSVRVSGAEAFWTKQAKEGASATVGAGLIKRVKQNEESREKDPKVD